MTITLYAEKHWDSPYVFTTFVALREKGLGFEEHVLDLDAGEQRSSVYASRSLTARVPAIDHDGFVLSESTAIVEYLEERFPPPEHARLLPEVMQERARARQLLGWIRSDLMPLREERSTDTMFYERAGRPLGPAARAAADKLLAVAGRLIAPGATSLFGSWCVADADLGFFLHRLILNGDEVPASIRAFAEAQWQRPSVRAYVEHPRPTKR